MALNEAIENAGSEVLEQAEIDWANALLDDFKPADAIKEAAGNGQDEAEQAEKIEVAKQEEVEEKVEEPEAIDEASYNRKVAIKNEDGSVGYKTVKDLIDERMYKADYTRKTQEVARERANLEEDKSILKLLDTDKHARDFLLKRIDDIKSGRASEADEDMDIPTEALEAYPWLRKIVDKVKKHDVEVSKYRKTEERTQADQAVGKINSVMEAAQVAVEKETGLKLEPAGFRNRVGKIILDSLDDRVPEDKRISVAGQLMLADKNYYLSKARESYQQEIELAKEKAIDAAKQERARKASEATTPLKGGGTSVSAKDVGEFKMVKDKQGRPDMDAFLESVFTKKK